MKVHCNDCGEDFEITPEHHLKYNNGGCPNCHKYKKVICTVCGNETLVDRHATINEKTYMCKDCHKKLRYLKRSKNVKKENNENNIIICCKICGRPLNSEMKCDNDFCNKHNCQIFKTLIKYFGFDETKYGTIEVEEEFHRISEMIREMYWDKHMSSTEICNYFNYPDPGNLTGKVFKYLGIQSKNHG